MRFGIGGLSETALPFDNHVELASQIVLGMGGIGCERTIDVIPQEPRSGDLFVGQSVVEDPIAPSGAPCSLKRGETMQFRRNLIQRGLARNSQRSASLG